MRRQTVTLKDIAERVGVSKATVSYLLSDAPSPVKISDATRERVLTAAREMGYRPHRLARALARRRTDTITLVLHSPDVFAHGSGFVSELMRGVLEAANARGVDVVLHTKALPHVAAEVDALTDGRSDGALVLRDFDDPLAQRLQESGHPTVVIFARSLAPEVYCIDTDNAAGGRLAAEYLLGLGHTRFGLIDGPAGSSAVHDRRAGYEAALAARGIALDPADVVAVTDPAGDFAPLAARLCAPDPPTALLAWSDDVAAAALTALRRDADKHAPHDFSLIGFDDSSSVCERCLPPLTSVAQPIREIARRSLERLNELLEGELPTPRVVNYLPTLTPRSSCAPPPTSKKEALP